MLRLTLILILIALSLFTKPVTSTVNEIQVLESKSRIILNKKEIVLLLTLNNIKRAESDIKLEAELINTEGHIVSKASSTGRVADPLIKLSLPFNVDSLSRSEREKLLWYSIHYKVSYIRQDRHRTINGINSLAKLTQNFFELTVASHNVITPGTEYEIRVRALNPITSRPVQGVEISLKIELDSNFSPEFRAITSNEGYAFVKFVVPTSVNEREGNIRVKGVLGGIFVETDEDFFLDKRGEILITTDKPIYQPGQKLNIRALTFNSTKHAIPNEKVAVKITDEEGQLMFREEKRSTRFGVVSTSWNIPKNIRLGTFTITTEIMEGRFRGTEREYNVKISRYELPNFTITVKPDRTFYLPGQNASIEVNTDYLFGKPLVNGSVRIVRESERSWDYRTQRWKIDEKESYTGQTNTNGIYIHNIDLTTLFSELNKESYLKYEDYNFSVYVTDPSTNRTEQHRFDLRISKEPLHVYAISTLNSRGLPLEFYVTTFSADGTPVEADVNITSADPSLRGVKRRVRTNQYGVAKVLGDIISPSHEYYDLNLTAITSNGLKGSLEWKVYVDEGANLRVLTDKSLYAKGENIKVKILSGDSLLRSVFMEVRKGTKQILSKQIRLIAGTTYFEIPYQNDFKNEVTINVYSGQRYTPASYPLYRRNILFPDNENLRIKLNLDKQVYSPGDEAVAKLRVEKANGLGIESAIGVVVVDKAVEERARTDREYGSGDFCRMLYSLWNGSVELSGITLNSLRQIDMSTPLPKGLDLLSEILLMETYDYGYSPRLYDSDFYETDVKRALSERMSKQLNPVYILLMKHYINYMEYPTNLVSLKNVLARYGADLENLKDPWNNPYQVVFYLDQIEDVLELNSNGPDKIAGTKDDFKALDVRWQYFRKYGEEINKASLHYYSRTTKYIRDEATLKSELRSRGLDFERLMDPWGNKYSLEFGVDETYFTIRVISSGPNRVFDGLHKDDFTVWTSKIDYFAGYRNRIEATLSKHVQDFGLFPHTFELLNELLMKDGLDLRYLKDAWDNTVYAVFDRDTSYTDRVTIENHAVLSNREQKTFLTPVSETVAHVFIKSKGPDKLEGTWDDFVLLKSSKLIYQESKQFQYSPQANVVFSGDAGAIIGSVTDPTGAVVPNVTVTATDESTAKTYQAISNNSGIYILNNLPVSMYRLRFSAEGFKPANLSNIRSYYSRMIEVNVTLEVGPLMEMVAVNSDAIALQTTSSGMISKAAGQVSVNSYKTPRLRDYFPETLVWSPLIETDKEGHASIKFSMADNITTWNIAVVGSTATGEIGTLEREIKSFQPFFIEHGPPKVLTVGDWLSLPVIFRNYTENSLSLNVSLKPEKWFSPTTSQSSTVNIDPNNYSRNQFGIKVISSEGAARSRVEAGSSTMADAVEKSINVVHNGDEVSRSSTTILTNSATFEANIPDHSIENSSQAELKIYPNLITHVIDSIEGIISRPHGCAEQTISAAYPSLMLLRYLKSRQLESTEFAESAERYTKLAYERILNFRTSNGGFSYFGGEQADYALTAYAIKFLHDSAELIAVDGKIEESARNWLLKEQRTDGSWPAKDWNNVEDIRRTGLLTAYISKILSQTGSQPSSKASLNFIDASISEIDEPYILSLYLLAALELKEAERSKKAAERLKKLAKRVGDTYYWHLETNTPFYGWGIAGQIETTALCLSALTEYFRSENSLDVPSNKSLLDGALLFLLNRKDKYNVWYSTQATINTLEAMMRILSIKNQKHGSYIKDRIELEVKVNGDHIRTVSLPDETIISAPLSVDLSSVINSGENRITLTTNRPASPFGAQLVHNYFVPWSRSNWPDENSKNKEDNGLNYSVSFDKQNVNVGEQINCNVAIERKGFSGYGMMIAEAGLPPGSEVDRESLDKAMINSNWSLSYFEVLPEKIVFYVWPRAEGTSFTFKFRTRFAMSAQSMPSVLYDYYNPQARILIPPVRFVSK
jgi:hypothetical protein